MIRKQPFNIENKAEISKGSVYSTFTCNLLGHGEVFVKKLEFTNKNPSYTDEIVRVRENPSEYILKCVAISGNEQFSYEKWNGKTLRDLITSYQRQNLTWQSRLSFALSIAKGLKHIHSLHVFHGYLSSLSIAYFGDGSVKIADVGINKIIKSYSESKSIKNMDFIKYMSPESIQNSNTYSAESDVYSFGIILWEIVTGSIPYDGIDAVQCESIIISGKKPVFTQDTPTIIKQLICRCIHQNPDMRPKVAGIIMEIELIMVLFERILRSLKFIDNRFLGSEYFNLFLNIVKYQGNVNSINNEIFQSMLHFFAQNTAQNIDEANNLVKSINLKCLGAVGDFYLLGEYYYAIGDTDMAIECFRKEDEIFVPAKYCISMIKYDGLNNDESEGVFTELAKLGYGPAYYKLSQIQEALGKSKESFGSLLNAARCGITECYYNIGMRLMKGIGASVSLAESAKYFILSAILDHPESQYYVGYMYHYGRSVPLDYKEAVYWYKLAEQNKEGKASAKLGFMSEHGQGMPKNESEAINYYINGASNNDPLSNFKAGFLYAYGENTDYSEDSIGYYLAAIENIPAALYETGILYENRVLGYVSPEECKEYFFQSSMSSFTPAQISMGLYHLKKREYKEAYEYFSLAAAKESSLAQMYLGLMYYNGQYVEKNIKEAKRLMTLAVHQGETDAGIWLREM